MVIEEAWTEIFSFEVDGCFVRRFDYEILVFGDGDGIYGSYGDFYCAVGEDCAGWCVDYAGIFEYVGFLWWAFPGFD